MLRDMNHIDIRLYFLEKEQKKSYRYKTFTKDLQDSALLGPFHNLNNLLHVSKKLR